MQPDRRPRGIAPSVRRNRPGGTSAARSNRVDPHGCPPARRSGDPYNSGTAALVFCTVDDNAASAGGGIDADPSGQPVVLIGTEVKRNKGGNIAGRVIRL
jgi:hypothetical protein